jgi:hypothetical protein
MIWDSRYTCESEVENEGREKIQKKTRQQMRKKHKVIVIGDSHARGCVVEIKSNLEDFEVQGVVSPGAGINTIITSATRDIQQLPNKMW